MTAGQPLTRGRRAADRRGTGVGGTGSLAVVLVVLAAGLALLTGRVHDAAVPPPRATSTSVEAVTDVCLPTPRGGRVDVRTVAAPLPDVGADGTVTTTDAEGSKIGEHGTRRGVVEALEPDRQDALVLTAQGPAAVGRATYRTDRDRGTGTLALQECTAPRARWWFTGAGVDADHSSQLVLANVDTGPAVVDLAVYGPRGPVETVDTRGITLAPGDVEVVDLADVAPQTGEVAIHVETSRGRVVAAVHDTVRGEDGLAGVEWLPPQAEVSRRLRLAPLVGRAELRTLVVANPSDREALVEVAVSGRAGSFAPTEGGQVRVPPGAVVTTDLTDTVGRDASALTLRSTTRVAATLRSTGAGDVSYAPAAPVLTGPATAAVPAGARAVLHLSAGAEGASATVSSYATDGSEVGSDTLDLDPGATQRWAPGRGAAYVLVTPGAGWAYGGLVTTGSGGATQARLHPLAVNLRRPAVVPAVG